LFATEIAALATEIATVSVRATWGHGAVHSQGSPLRIREDGGEEASNRFYDDGIAGGAIFNAYLPKKVMELKFMFQGSDNVANEFRGRGHCLQLNNTVERICNNTRSK
jgi:hypothetical protein